MTVQKTKHCICVSIFHYSNHRLSSADYSTIDLNPMYGKSLTASISLDVVATLASDIAALALRIVRIVDFIVMSLPRLLTVIPHINLYPTKEPATCCFD